MFGLGAQELLIILFIVVVIFGGTQLPKLAQALGSSIRQFKDGLRGNVESTDSTNSTPPNK